MTAPGVVGSARVEITGDLGAFATQTESKIKDAFRSIEPGANEKMRQLGQNLGHELDSSLARGVRENGSQVKSSVDSEAAKAGSSARGAFGKYGREAGQEFTHKTREGLSGLKTAVIGGIGAVGFEELIKGSVEAADALEGANIKIEHVFGESGKSVETWAKGLGASFGVSQADAESLAGSFAQIFSPLHLAGDESARMSEHLVELTQDVARFNNADPAKVQSALIAGLRGRGTALRQYGIAISNSTVQAYAYAHGIAAAGSKLTDAQKTQAAYNLILQQTRKQQGAVADSSDTLAQRKKVLEARVVNLKAAFGNALFPILSTVAGFMINDVVPALQSVGHWVVQNKDWLVPLVIAIGSAVAVYKLVNLATNLWSTGMQGLRAVMSLFIPTAEATAVAEGEVDAAMDANPIGLVVAAIAALVAAFIYAWNHSKTFRKIILEVWNAIKDAALFVWHNVFEPVGHGIVTALNWIKDAALFLWHNVIEPVASGIETAWKAIGDGLRWVWTHVIKKVIDAITTAWHFLHDHVIAPVAHAISAAWKIIGTGLEWVWHHIIKPILDGITGAIQDVKDALDALNPFKSIDGKGIIKKFLHDRGLSTGEGSQSGPSGPPTVHPHALGGDLGPVSLVGEDGPELLIRAAGNRAGIISNPGTSGGNFAEFAAALADHAGLSQEDRDLLMAIATRPQQLVVDSTVVAQAANNGNLRLARR